MSKAAEAKEMTPAIQATQAPTVAAARQDFPALLDRSQGEIAKVLPEGISVERVCRMALTAYKMNPEIQKCTAMSILASVMKAAELGLEPGGGLKQCWLIPFKDHKKGIIECTFVIGYQGVLELARRSGQFRLIDARVVLDSDPEFTLSYTPRATIVHRPDLSESGREIGAYAYVVLGNGEQLVEWMSRKTLDKIQALSKQPAIWVQWWGEKAKNAALKRLLKRQPLSVALRRAIELDDEQEAPAQQTAIAPAFREPAGLGLSRSAALGQRLKGAEAETEGPLEVPMAEGPEPEPDLYAEEGGANN